jgi:hypothetical protein
MAPKKVTRGEKPKRKFVIYTIEMEKELITECESGTRLLAKSTISTGLKNKEAIKPANVAKAVKTLTSKRLPVVEENK